MFLLQSERPSFAPIQHNRQNYPLHLILEGGLLPSVFPIKILYVFTILRDDKTKNYVSLCAN
jgi:hypothetical protein